MIRLRPDWERVEAGLDILLALPAGERGEAIERIAGADSSLRLELQSLLEQFEGDDPLLDRPILREMPGDAAPSGSLAVGTRVGAYRLLTLIGRGGMGEVYRAERADGQYQQWVALKLVRRELADQPLRFQSERQTLARLDHPSIARLLDGGVAEDGRPYMVMELVVGKNLIAWCAEHAAPLEERLRLFIEVCAAVEYAHRNLIVHRDLKPGNVLVTAEATVKLLDFGIAKLLGSGGDEAPTQNAPMTPGYAAPEQLLQGAITTATDVYALGMLLFELLTGERPWKLRELSFAAAIEKVLRESPPAPSAFARSLPQPPVAFKALRGDLDAIVAKAVRKEPEARYESVAALRADVERSLRHQPVSARDGARLYAFGRLLRRYRVWVASAALVAAAIMLGTAATLWQARAARLEAHRAAAVKDFLLDIFEHNSVNNPDGAKARQTTAEQLLDIGAERIRTGLGTEPQVRGQLLDVLVELYDQLDKFDKVVELEKTHLAEIAQRDGGRASAEKATSQFYLGRALVMQGNYAEAYSELNAALRSMDAIKDYQSDQRAETLLETGRIAYHRGTPQDLKAARRYAAESLAIYQQGNSRNPDRLFPIQLLGRIAEKENRSADAERSYREFLALAQQPQFADDPNVLAHGHDDLGSMLLDRRRFREAEPELRKAVDIFARSEGEKQLDTAVDKAYLGELLVDMNRPDEGEPLLEEALAALEGTQGADNVPSTALIRARYARVELRRGNLTLASKLLGKNIAVYESKSPNNGTYWPLTLQLDARLQIEQRRFPEAAADLARADRLWAADTVNDGGKHGIDRVLEAQVALATGASPEATEASLQAVRAAWPASGAELSEVHVLATLTLGDAYLQQRQPQLTVDIAQALLQRILAEPEHEFLADWEARSHLLLGMGLLASGKADTALPHLQRAVALRERFDTAASPWLAQARNTLAASQSVSGGLTRH